jgi:hypothetical protein
MRNRNDKLKLAGAVAGLLLGSVAFAQSPDLTQPNNSAGTVLDTPPALQTPAPDVPPTVQPGPSDMAQTVQPPFNNPLGLQFPSAPEMQPLPGPTSGTGLPSETENPNSAFDKLDPTHRGYVTREDMDRLPGRVPFEQADINHDGKLDLNEFQRAWTDYGNTSQ